MDMGTTLVLGGTGKTGRRIVERLMADGLAVRVASRSGRPPFAWEDPATWSPVLHGVESVYLSYAPDLAFAGAADRVGALAELAVRQGTRRIVLLSGRNEPEAQRAERLVQASGADWTVIRSSFFAQNFSEGFLLDGVLAGEVAFPAGDVAEPFVDVDDLAEIAVAALTDDRHTDRLYEVTGPRLLTFAEAVAEIAEAAGRQVRYVPVSAEQFSLGLHAAGLPADFVTELSDLFTTVLDGRGTYLTDGVRQALGRPPRDFTDYARTAAATGVWGDVARRAS
jgi:uncharacterized protein YbjT (DUF2867 family)